jgi:hypothetical protein
VTPDPGVYVGCTIWYNTARELDIGKGGECVDDQTQGLQAAKGTIELLLKAIDSAGRSIGPINGEDLSEETRMRLWKANLDLQGAYYEATGGEFLQWWVQ